MDNFLCWSSRIIQLELANPSPLDHAVRDSRREKQEYVDNLRSRKVTNTQDCPNTQITRTAQMENQTAEKVAYLADVDRQSEIWTVTFHGSSLT